ncbi:MAG: hypothetical protein NVS1B14_09360 [Vulcanimicrobiaceae bacterium]
MRILATLLMGSGLVLTAILPTVAGTHQGTPPGGKNRDCHGYVRHVSLANVRVHCIDGVPSDMSFLAWPKFIDAPNGKTVQTKDLKPGTPVHVIYTQSLGVRHVYKVYVADPRGRGLFGFKS